MPTNDSNLYVSIKNCLSGGGKECNICGEMAQYSCDECKQEFCCDCCSRVHQHKKRINHKPRRILCSSMCEDGDHTSWNETSALCSISQPTSHSSIVSSKYNDEEVFTHAMMIATLAEHFNLTEFKPFQKIVIDNLMCGNDCLVIQPTGSGKSLCYQFPAIYGNKVSLVITPVQQLV